MRTKKFYWFLVFFLFALQGTTFSQGGWDVWTVYLSDGSRIEAAPVWSLDKEFLKYGMSGEVGEGKKLKRSMIVSMSRNVAAGRTDPSLPKAPEGDVKKDLIVLHDGRQLSGDVLIRAEKNEKGVLKHFSPVLVQNGVEIKLTEVEHIKFAKPERTQ